MILILVIRRVPNHSSWTACFGLIKLSTCRSLLIARGHSTWFGAQILTQIFTVAHTYTSFYLMLLSTCSTLGTYGIGYTLNKLTMGFLFYGDKVTVISVYYFFKLVYIYSHAFCLRNYLVYTVDREIFAFFFFRVINFRVFNFRHRRKRRKLNARKLHVPFARAKFSRVKFSPPARVPKIF